MTTAQLALVRMLHKGDFVAPVPNARKVRHLEESAVAEMVLTPPNLAAIEEAMPHTAVSDGRASQSSRADSALFQLI